MGVMWRVLVCAVALSIVGVASLKSLAEEPKAANAGVTAPEVTSVLKFSFGPAGYKGIEGLSTLRDGFTPVYVTSDYSKEAGFGWVGASGEVRKDWLESRGVLNSRARPGPNDLLAGWIAGGLPFQVDVPNGKYMVTASVGDWGEYEFITYESYTLLYQGKDVFDSLRGKDNLDQWYYANKYADYQTRLNLFDRYVKSRFDVVTKEIHVTDGKITVQARPQSGTNYMGPINYVVITPAAGKEGHEAFLKALEARMREQFDRRFPLQPVKHAYCDAVSDSEKDAGFALIQSEGGKIYPSSHGTRDNRVTKLTGYGTLGQFEAIDFGVVPLSDIGSLTCTVTDLEGPRGAKIPSGEVKVGYVKYWEVVNRDKHVVNVEPYLVMDRNIIPYTEEDISRQWWLVVHVPEDARGGTYKGTVTVKASKAGETAVPLAFDVMAVKLDGPGAVLLLNYTLPWSALFYGDSEAWWTAVEKDLEFQRDYGMTSVAVSDLHLPIDDRDTSEWERFIDTYRKVGMEGPIYMAGTMNLYGRFRNLLDASQEERYVAVFRALEDAARRKRQEVIYSICDETTNDGKEAVAETAARLLHERLPDLKIIGDINGYRELTRCAPYLTAAGFNNGWHGNYGTNRRYHDLIVSTVIDRVKALGAAPWFVNGGTGRYPFGLFLWRMQSFGVAGKCEWHYYAATSDPYNPFDSQELNAFGSLVFPEHIPTLMLEQSRRGINDLRFTRTLERVVAETSGDTRPLVAARAAAAREALDYWMDRLPDRMVTDHTQDGSASYSGAEFTAERLAQARLEMAYHLSRLLELGAPSVRPPEFMLASWEKEERTGWEGIEPAEEHATDGEFSGRMVFARPGQYFDNWGRLRTKDWRGFTSFRFDAFNPESRDVALVFTIRDQLAANFADALAARKTVEVSLKPGENRFVLPLVGITDDGGRRPLDLSCVFNAIFTVKNGPGEVTLYVDNMRLVEDR